MINSYKELIVWQKSFKLVKQLYEITKAFPKSETYGIISQIRRAAVSIPSNIAEGFVRKSKKEFSQFVAIAFGSGAELETQLLLAQELGFVTEQELKTVNSLLQEVMKMLNSLLSKLK
jgi:four helix bundle protein